MRGGGFVCALTSEKGLGRLLGPLVLVTAVRHGDGPARRDA